MKHSPVLLLAVVCALALSGCATKRPAATATVDASMVELNAVAQEAANTLGKLAYARNAQAASQVSPAGLQEATLAATADPSGWEQKVSLDYEGPFHILVERLSLKAGYRYVLYGRAPPAAPLVGVSVKDAALIEVMRDIVAQVPDTVQINIYPATRSVTVSYRG